MPDHAIQWAQAHACTNGHIILFTVDFETNRNAKNSKNIYYFYGSSHKKLSLYERKSNQYFRKAFKIGLWIVLSVVIRFTNPAQQFTDRTTILPNINITVSLDHLVTNPENVHSFSSSKFDSYGARGLTWVEKKIVPTK